MSNFAKYENLQALFTAIGKKKLSVSDTMPTAGAAYEDICILYIGPTDANYTKGYVYECEEVTPATDPKTYSWNAKINVDVDLSKYKTIFPGTKEEWEALTEAQQDQYDYCFFDGDESDYYAVSDEVTKGNMHPVTSNAVADILETKTDKVSNATNGNFAGLDANGNLTDSGEKASDFATAANLANYINENGAINQFDMTLSDTKSVNTGGTWDGNAFTYRGLTYTVNADNIVITGTPTDNSFFYLLARNIPAGKYTFGGLKDAANIIWDGGFWLYNGSVETAISTGAAGTKNDFTVDLSSYTFDRIKFGIKRKSNTLTNDTIKLFIRKADINVDVNAPYAMTNKELTDELSLLTGNAHKWVAGRSYSVGDCIFYNGELYYCIGANSSSTIPTQRIGVYWTPASCKGISKNIGFLSQVFSRHTTSAQTVSYTFPSNGLYVVFRGGAWLAPIIYVFMIRDDIGYKFTISKDGITMSERVTDGSLKTFEYTVDSGEQFCSIYRVAG